MSSPAEPSRSPQEALLHLEKSSGSPTTLLNHAADILGLNLALCASHPEINRLTKTRTASAPKAEWVLRWLLKKLKTSAQFRVQPASFLLLTQLFTLIHPKALAAIVTEYEFLRLVKDVFADLEGAVFTGLEDGFAEVAPSGSESSLTLGSSPVENRAGDKKGTKRKRSAEGGNGDSMEIEETLQTSASCLLAFIRVLDCIYSLVVLVTETLGDDEVARSRLTQAIRCGPESGAVMLAKSFRIAAIATSHFFQCRMITDLQHLMYVVPAVLGIWRLRASQDASETKASNDYFAKYCFPSALRLQHCISHTDLDTDERSQALFGIQRLIAVHVVLPARMAFLERGGSGIDYSADEPDWSAVKPVTDTFRPLLCGNDDEGSDSKELPTQARKMKESWKTAELLPAFFDTAARCVPRDTFRRQNHEAPWLETLFVAVAELAFSFAKEENPSTYFPEFVGVLEQLFRVVLDRDVKLSLHTLLTHASYSGLLKDELTEVEWNLTALLIKLGVDIFLPNSGFSYSKKLLNALLEKIMLYWHSGISDGNYDVIKYGIVIPLARGFTAARDLPTFMEMWYEQLVAMEEARIGDSSLSYFSVWEDDDLCAAYGELVQTPFMDTHIVAQMRAAAVDIKGTHGRISTSPSSYAKFVVLEASLRTRRLNLAAADEALLTIVETLSATVSSKQSLHWRWRLWRLARNLLENNLQSTNSPLGNTIVELITVAAESIHRRHKDFSKKPCAPLENFEAYRFTLVAMNGPTNASRWDKFNTITEEVVAFIKSVSNGEASKSMNSPWNGRMETLNSQSSLALGYFLLLVRSPSRWEQMQVETRRALFEHIVKLAASQYDPRSSALDSPVSDARFLQAWASLVCHEYLLNSPSVIGDLIHVLADCVKRDPANRKLYVMSLQRIPAPSFTRRQRGIVLDLLQGVIVQESNSLEVTVGMVSLMAKLADLPKSSAAVTNDWEPIWKMAKAVSLEGAELDLQIVKAFRSLHRAVITKLLVLSSGERSKQFPKLFRKLESMVSHMRSIDENSMGHALLQISLTHLWTHREELSNVVDESTLGSCREKVFDLVVGSVKRVKSICKKQESGKTVPMTKILDSLDDFQDLATGNAEVVELLEKIEDYVEKSDDFKPSVQRLIRRCVLAGQEPKKEVTQPMMRCAEIFSVQYLYGEDQQLFIRAAMEKLRSMTTDDLVQVMAEITGPGAIKKDCQHLVLVAALVAAALPPVEDKDSQAAGQLSSLFTVVSQVLVHCKTIEQFAMATECLDTLFHQHPRCVDQFDIDGLLSAISLCLSRYGPHINPRYASAVYVRLCRLVGVVVGLLRQRVGGRHHLIINILTRLLNCLLDRSKKQGRALEKDKNQPYWIAPLQASDAAHFTRLLTSLSDPTLSSVSRPSAHEGLTDQTKKAKRITGQYLQYFVMEYARMSLQGTFSPQIKAAIMPGLYSILDGLSREAMRSLNAELEVSSRAVFKGLYDDYAKFGKWNKA